MVTDDIAFSEPGRILRKAWASELVAARSSAMTKDNIMVGWREAGLQPPNRDKLIFLLQSQLALSGPVKPLSDRLSTRLSWRIASSSRLTPL